MSDARAWVEVDLGALVRNARALAAHARKPLIPMVKADAYGLGAVPVARALEAVDPLAYGVSSIPEAIELREAGITRPIILFTPAVIESPNAGWRSGDAPLLMRHAITPTLARREDILAWGAGGDRPAYHLAIDTGMHRAGANDGALDGVLAAAAQFPPDGAFTHLHSSEYDNGSMERQEARFRAAVARLPRRPRLLHVENSGGIVRRSPSEWDCVRPGVFLYGVGSGPRAALQPEPVVSLRARILEKRTIGPGESVSYGASWQATRVTDIATVACGYADGLRRHLGNRAHALIGGRAAPIRGVVTMDMAMLEVTDIACDIGDVVTFLGSDSGATLTAEAVAAAGEISPYELLVGLKLRLPRIHTGA